MATNATGGKAATTRKHLFYQKYQPGSDSIRSSGPGNSLIVTKNFEHYLVRTVRTKFAIE